MPANYYELLGVSQNASSSEINKAFKTKAKNAHPDKGGDTDRMKHLQKARETLTSQQHRDLYDSLGHYEYVQRYDGPLLDASPSHSRSNQTTSSSPHGSNQSTRGTGERRRSQTSTRPSSTDPSNYAFVDHDRKDDINGAENSSASTNKNTGTNSKGASVSQIRGATVGAVIISILFSVPSAWYFGSNFPFVFFFFNGDYFLLASALALIYITGSLLYLKRRLQTRVG